MIHKFTIYGRLDALNTYTSANRTNVYAGAKLKKDNENLIIWSIRKELKRLKIDRPILIYYNIYEPNKRRDHDNVLSCVSKFTQDSLVKTEILSGDGWKNIHRFYYDIGVDKKNPRIDVTITELTKEQCKLDLFNLLKDLEEEDG